VKQPLVEGIGFHKCQPKISRYGSIFLRTELTFADAHVFLDHSNEMFLEIMKNGFGEA
jgi:hypothetical protein